MTGQPSPAVGAASASSDATLREALATIDRGGIGLAVFLDPAGRFVGLVTDGDVRRALLSGASLEDPALAAAPREPTVARVGMERDEIASLLSEQVRALPVLDDVGRVVDIALLDRRVHLPVAAPELGERELAYVAECILTGWVSSAGTFVRRFEAMFAELCGTKHALAVTNGTVALHLALLAAGVGPGDEVIVPTLTFAATANAAVHCGATPVFVDVDLDTWTIDPAEVERALTPRTRAVVPVHLYGHPADLDPLLELGRAHGVAIVEDAAEAHGARYKGRPVGGLGDVGIFSFYGNKIVTTGEGGMVVTDDDAIAERVRILRDHGMTRPGSYEHLVVGFNARMTNLQAAVGVAQTERLDELLAAKRQLAARYDAGLAQVPGLAIPIAAPWAESVCWLYTIRVEDGRDALIGELKEEGVEARPVFPPVHRQPAYGHDFELPRAEEIAATGLSLPSSSALSAAEVERVVDALRARAHA